MITLKIEIRDMQQLQDVLRILQPEVNPVSPQEEKPKRRTKKKAAKKAEPELEPHPDPEVALHTTEDVHAMARRVANVNRDGLVNLLNSVGAEKLVQLTPNVYNEFMDGAAALLKAESDG
jgi:hypothetical protein